MPSLPPPTPEAKPPLRKGELTAQRILDAAEELFAERGYEGATLRDVAEAVGIRTPSLYNHFESKDALYRAVLARGAGPVLEMLTRFVASPVGARPDPSTIVEGAMALLRAHPRLPRLVLHETLAGGQRLTPLLREFIRPIFARAHEMAAERSSEWTPEQIPHVVLAVYHALIGYFAIAPLYADLNDKDLMTAEAFDRQTQVLIEIVARLFPEQAHHAAPIDRPKENE